MTAPASEASLQISSLADTRRRAVHRAEVASSLIPANIFSAGMRAETAPSFASLRALGKALCIYES